MDKKRAGVIKLLILAVVLVAAIITGFFNWGNTTRCACFQLGRLVPMCCCALLS